MLTNHFQSQSSQRPPTLSIQSPGLPFKTESVGRTHLSQTAAISSDRSLSQAYSIACIDDNVSVLRTMKYFLEVEGFSVVMISDPVRALMQIIRCKPDLILLDVTMPNLDGYELCSLLRRHSAFKNIPIIIVTGNTGLIDRAKAKLVRASDYLTKPFSKSDLIQIVQKHLP